MLRFTGVRLAGVAGAVLGFIAVAAAAVDSRAGASPATQSPATVSAAAGTFFFGLTPQFAVSPDGRQVVFVANAPGTPPALWVQPVASGTPRQIAGTDQASYPFWSPDSRSIGFFSGGKLKTVPVNGGPVAVVCDAPTGRGGTWNDSNLIVFSSGLSDPLRSVPASGGVPQPATVIDAARENSHRWPQFMPDGRHLLFWAGGGKGRPELKIAALGSSEAVSVGPADANGAYAAGHLYFKTGNVLMAQPLDARTFALTGEPTPVVEPISTDAGSFFASFSVAPTGTVLYTRGTARPSLLTWFDRSGRRLGTVGEPGQYTNATFSPDGARLAVSLTAGTPANRDVWIIDVSGGTRSRATTDAGVDATPVWSPTGDEIVFSSTRSGVYQVYRRAANSSAQDELLFKDDRASIATDWSPNGHFVAYTRTGPASSGLDIWLYPIAIRQPFALIQTPGTDDNAAFSPDGRWIAYQSSASGRDEVYITSAPPPPSNASGTMPAWERTQPIQISRAGGTQPRWRNDGRELFFLAADGSVMAAAPPAGTGTGAAEPRAVLPPSMTLVIRHAYAVSADGQRILMPVLDQSTPSVITVTQRK